MEFRQSYFKYNDINMTLIKWWKKIYYTKIKFKNWVSVFVSYKVISRIKKFSKEKEDYWLVVKGLIYQWDIVILNVPLHQQQNSLNTWSKNGTNGWTERRNKKIHNYSWEIQSPALNERRNRQK